MSFFDLENELPHWLDEVIVKYPQIREIVSLPDINSLDPLSRKSYHFLCADKGNMVGIGENKPHHIWKFQHPKYRTYGKYLESFGNTSPQKFLIGLVETDDSKDLYLWFPFTPVPVLKNKSKLTEESDKNEHWFKNNTAGMLNLDDLTALEKEIKNAACVLLDEIP